MAELTTEYLFEEPLQKVFEGIRQYQLYPEYLPGVTKIEVLPPKAPQSSCRVRYDLKLIKTFFYTLNMFEEAPHRIWWNLDESNIMKQSSGSWDFTAQGNNTKAIYKLDIGFSGFVPSMVIDQITKANLPLMMQGFAKLISRRR